MNNQLPVSMHPRYNDFLAFMANCPYRKTPETLQTAFWAWINVFEDFEELLKDHIDFVELVKETSNQIGAL